MSETYEKILVKDDRLGCITPKVKFQVFKGGQKCDLPAIQGDFGDHCQPRV